MIEPALKAHLEALRAFKPSENAKQENYDKEIELVTKVLKVEEERAQNIEDPPMYPNEKAAHVQTWPDGTRFIGVTSEGNKRNGPGIFTMSNGDAYEGTYVNNKREGKGEYRYADGSTYVGGFSGGRREGEGVYVWADKRKYEGSYVDNQRHG